MNTGQNLARIISELFLLLYHDTMNCREWKETSRRVHFSFAKTVDFEDVYEPAEDSFFFMDVLSDEIDSLSIRQPQLCLEIGCGSGILLTHLALLLEAKHVVSHFVGIDINPHAVLFAQRMLQHNGIKSFDILRMSLLDSFRLSLQVDVIIFNPPYVVTPSEEIEAKEWIVKSWAGGQDGREVTNLVLPLIKVFYFILLYAIAGSAFSQRYLLLVGN